MGEGGSKPLSSDATVPLVTPEQQAAATQDRIYREAVKAGLANPLVSTDRQIQAQQERALQDQMSNLIIQQNSSKAVYGADPTAAAGFGATPNPNTIARMGGLSEESTWLIPALLGGLLLWVVAFRK